MTDDRVAELDALLATGGLRALTKRLHQSTIAGQEFLAADAGQTAPLTRHALLCDNSPASSPLNVAAEEVWRELSGSGRHYDGTFGLLPREGKLTILGREVDFSQDKPAAAIGRQVALCLRVFNAPSIPRTMPALARAVQRHFNDILIAHPVLLHPALLVPVQHNGVHSYMSVVHALAGSHFGALPRVNHYPRLAPDLLEPHLATLARHPCLKLGLGVSWHLSFDVDKGRMRRGRKSLVEHMLAIPAAKARFLGSAMEMDELGRRAGDNDPLPMPLAGRRPSGTQEEDDRLRVIVCLARSVLTASGAGSTDSGAVNTEEPDLAFLEDVRKRRHMLLADADFMPEIGNYMIRRVFSTRADDLSPQLVAERTDAVINGLVAAGLKANHAEAAQYVMDACIGSGRAYGSNGNLPKAESANAIAFLQALDAHGAYGSMIAGAGGISPARTLQLRALEVVRDYPAHQVPYRDQWVSALEAFWAEKVMSHQIASTLARHQTDLETRADTAGAGAYPSDAACADPKPPSGRRRSLTL